MFTNDPQSPDPAMFSNAGPYIANARPRQRSYITAAWSDANMVPPNFVVGDERITMVDGVTYFNAMLGDDREYAIFVRVEIVSDNDQVTSGCSHIYCYSFIFIILLG